jgi:hypothetical protein
MSKIERAKKRRTQNYNTDIQCFIPDTHILPKLLRNTADVTGGKHIAA